MPRYVALEWDQAEVRVAVARVRSGHVDLDHVLSIPLNAENSSPRITGNAIAEALKGIGVAGGDAIIAVGRASIELRFLSVPPVPPEELPELVRFQASRQFAQPIEEGLIDFAPLTASGNPPSSVLAAAIPAEQMKAIREVCDIAKLVPKHLVLRPFAVDALISDRLDPDSCILTVDRLSEEVDLTVVLGEQAVFPRSVRIGNYGDAKVQAATIVGEIRRTIAASQNQVAGHRVSGVYIFGQVAEQTLLAEAIRRELSLPTEIIDPLSVKGITAPEQSMPTGIGRFAPLFGALLDEAHGRRHEIDFLAPRKRPPPRDYKRTYTIAAAAAAVALLALFGAVYWQLSGLQGEIDRLADDSRKLDKTIKTAKPIVDHAVLLDEYAQGQVSWLDELKELSTDLPPADKVLVRDLSGDVVTKTGARLIIAGGAHSDKDIAAIEAKLRDDRHRISGSGGTELREEKLYPWTYRETITLNAEPDSKAPAAKKSAPKVARSKS